MSVDLQQLLPLFVRRELDRRVGNDAGHRGRVTPPEGHEALLGVRVAQKCQRRPERVGDVFAGMFGTGWVRTRNSVNLSEVNLLDLEVDLRPIEGRDRSFGQCTGDCSRNQTGDDYISIVESLVRVGDCDCGATATATTTTTITNAVT